MAAPAIYVGSRSCLLVRKLSKYLWMGKRSLRERSDTIESQTGKSYG